MLRQTRAASAAPEVVVMDSGMRTGRRFAELAKVFNKARAVDMVQGDTRFWQRTEWSSDAKEVLEYEKVREAALDEDWPIPRAAFDWAAGFISVLGLPGSTMGIAGGPEN